MAAWKERNGFTISQDPVAPGIHKVKEQPQKWYLRKKVTSQKTGRQVEIAKLIDAPNLSGAINKLDELIQQAQTGETVQPLKTRFCDYAVSLLEKKIEKGKLKEKLRTGREGIASISTLQSWEIALKCHLLPRFGDYFISEITRNDVLAYKEELEKEVAAGLLGAATANGRLSKLFTILQNAVAELDLTRNPTLKINKLPVGKTYTRENPNALNSEQAEQFLAVMHRRYPQHFAFFYLMYTLGLRPSSVRPLRCRGPNSDILWDQGILLVRRSHSRRQQIMNMTKTGVDQEFPLPKEILDILKWHIQTHHQTKCQQEGELLFCSPQGKLHHTRSLDWPCKRVAEELKIPFTLTPKGAGRRTHTSLHIESGATTEEAALLTGHHSSKQLAGYVNPNVKLAKQAAGIAKVIALADFRQTRGMSGGITGGQGLVSTPADETKGSDSNG